MGWRAVLIASVAFPAFLQGELLPIRTYNTGDGLASDQVNAIVADSRGFLWFCTPEGLSRFDGYRFIGFSRAEGLAHDFVSTLLETRSGEIFIGTVRGISRINSGPPGTGFATFVPEEQGADRVITALRESRSGKVWCATRRTLYEWDKASTFHRIAVPLPTALDRINDVFEDKDGNLWVGTTVALHVLNNHGILQTFTRKDGLPGDFVESLLLDSQGRMWAAFRGGLALLQQQSDTTWRLAATYTKKSGLSGDDVHALLETSDGMLWIGTNWGISRVTLGDGLPRLLKNIGRDQGLSDRQINSLGKDQAGNIWAGTEGAGVMRIGRLGFTTYREQDGLPTDRVWSVFEDEVGEVLAVTVNGPHQRSLSILEGGRFRTVAFPPFNGRAAWAPGDTLLQSRAGEMVGRNFSRAVPVWSDEGGGSGRTPTANLLFNRRHLPRLRRFQRCDLGFRPVPARRSVDALGSSDRRRSPFSGAQIPGCAH